METANFREATTAELLADLSFNIRHGFKVRFRHFVLETSHRLSQSGVAHRHYGNSKITVIDGQPATLRDADEQLPKPTVFDVRLKSEYLRGKGL